MPVANSQPVYPPASGAPIQSTWGQGVSEQITQKFASPADRDAKWTSPPNGALAWTPDYGGSSWIRMGGTWKLMQCDAAAFGSISAPSMGGNATMTLSTVAPNEARNWAVQDNWGMRPLVEGTYFLSANCIRGAAASGVNAVVSPAIESYRSADTANPWGRIQCFSAGSAGYWVGVTIAGFLRLTPANGDFIRLMWNGDAGGALDARSSWHAVRVGPY